MIPSTLKIFRQHGVQYIKDLEGVILPPEFRGRAVLSSKALDIKLLQATSKLCPTGALSDKPFSLDMGKCLFCGECALKMPSNISFDNDFHMWAFDRQALIVKPDMEYDAGEPHDDFSMFHNSLKMRQVSAGGDGANELELDAAGNVNFDMKRYGIEFTSSPRHSDALVVTGCVTKKMASALEATLDAMPHPRMIIAVGTDAISGGLFSDSEQTERSFFKRHTPDLYIAGHPAHPLTFIGGVRALTAKKEKPQQEQDPEV